jgi:hypothetical protein
MRLIHYAVVNTTKNKIEEIGCSEKEMVVKMEELKKSSTDNYKVNYKWLSI